VPPGFVVKRDAVLGTDLRAEEIADKYPEGVVPSGARYGYKVK